MEIERHALNLGMLLVNFQTLEFSIRAFLYEADNVSGEILLERKNLNEFIKGEQVSENAFTNRDSLGQLIDKYNGNAKVSSLGLTILFTFGPDHLLWIVLALGSFAFLGNLKLADLDHLLTRPAKQDLNKTAATVNPA